MEQIDKRKKIVELISRTLERDNLLNMRQSRMFVSNIWYEKLINEKQWDILLECFIKSLGLEFKIFLEGWDDWKGNLYESSGTSLLKEMREWERIIKKQSHLSRKLIEQETEQQKDLERITKSFENSTTREQLNRTIELCSPLYKKYGDGWMKELENKLLVNGEESFVRKFVQFVKRKSMDIIHLKEMKKEQKKQNKSNKVSK